MWTKHKRARNVTSQKVNVVMAEWLIPTPSDDQGPNPILIKTTFGLGT